MKMELALRLRRLKVGESFFVGSERERKAVCRTVLVLKQAGVLTTEIKTRQTEGLFQVYALKPTDSR